MMMNEFLLKRTRRTRRLTSDEKEELDLIIERLQETGFDDALTMSETLGLPISRVWRLLHFLQEDGVIEPYEAVGYTFWQIISETELRKRIKKKRPNAEIL